MTLSLRLAQPHDCRRVFEWASDPTTRTMSFSSATIEWAGHQRWYAARMADPDTLFLIAEQGGAAVGQLRFACAADQPRHPNAIVSIGVAPPFRRRGLAARMLVVGLERMVAHGIAERVDAYIKPENTASLRLFEKAGFGALERTTWGSHPAIRTTWPPGRA